MKRTSIGLLLMIVALFTLPTLLAQTNLYDITSDDEKIRDTLGKFSIVKLLIVPIVTVFVMAARKWIMMIPDQLWPWVVPFLGVGLEFLGAKLGFWTGSIEAGLAMGGLATWFSQLGKQTKEAANKGFTTTKSGEGSESKPITEPPK